MEQWVFSFEQAAGLPAGRIGAKAAGLIRLRQGGLTVPDGFIIAADAYTHHMQAIGLRQAANTGELQQLRQRIIEAPIAPQTVSQIENGYRDPAHSAVAVRSSSVAEDLPNHSFAGQYDSFLNVSSLDACLLAVKKCWACAWTERAFLYRQKNGIDHAAAAMAVIVQSMVRADCAGVVFTQDPVFGRRDRIVIEFCAGYGDKLVSGQIRPDRWIFDKNSIELVLCELADQTRPACLNPDQAKSLAERAIQIEKVFGSPQDIEWAVEQGRVFFLQSRPITTGLGEKTFEDRQVWTNMNTGEVLPDVVTPMTWSLISRLFNPLFKSVWRMIGADLDDHPVAGLIAGRAYFNVSTGVASTLHFPKRIQKKMGVDELLGGRLNTEIESGRLKFSKEDLPDVNGSLWKLLWRIPETLYRLWRHRPSQSLLFLEKLRTADKRLKSVDLAQLSDRQLCDLIQTTIRREFTDWDLLFIGTGIAAYPLLRNFCRKRFDDQNGELANRFIRGQQGMEDVQAGFDLWNLAVAAGQSEQVTELLLSGQSFSEIEPLLRSSEPGTEYADLWNAFMDEHGHHCRGELELYNARWAEQPDYILNSVRNYLSGIGQVNPVEKYRLLQTERDRLYQTCLDNLRNPVHRGVFKYLVKQIRFGLMLRENWKSTAVRLVMHLRRMLVEVGQRLQSAGILEKRDDIFFLAVDQILPAADYRNVPELRQTIQSRRDEYEYNKTLSPPHLVVGVYRPSNENRAPQVADKTVLKGLVACPGKVTGKARVILKADEHQHVQPGEILVAPFTDPAWTPYFMTAAALVVDMGGLLSHGSIVAREYGIPAVVNVGPATEIIKTGQLIEVDANEGVVRILS